MGQLEVNKLLEAYNLPLGKEIENLNKAVTHKEIESVRKKIPNEEKPRTTWFHG